MRSWKTWTAVALGLGVAIVGAVRAQSGDKPAAKASPLSAIDYIQIKQLANRFPFAYDTGAAGGCEFADLFTSDGEFQPDKVKGRDQLAALARYGVHGPFRTSLYAMNHFIEPSPEGARGKQYVVEIRHDDNIPPVPPGESQWNLVGQKRGEVTTTGGHYEDIYVKTAEGWRFKRREFIPSQGGPHPKASIATPPVLPAGPGCGPRKPAAPTSTLTPMDYIEIEKLVASYGHALDSGYGKGENGEAYAGLYTRDAAFGRTSGHDALAELGRVQPHSATYVRHYLTNHVIEGTSGGARGKQYLVVIDIGENGAPGSIFLGGHYEDVYMKTAEGWRIKTRTLFRAQSGPEGKAAPTR
jgi:actinorhodin biosynthesis protein ActVIA